MANRVRVVNALYVYGVLLNCLSLQGRIFRIAPNLTSIRFGISFIFVRFRPISLLNCFLHLSANFLLSPVGSQSARTSNGAQVLHQIVVGLFRVSIVASRARERDGVSLRLIRDLHLGRVRD